MHFNPNVVLSSFILYAIGYFVCVNGKLKEGECEVCIKLLNKFSEQLDSNQKGDADLIEKEFVKFCKTVRGKEERFCYYVGGLETSATKILNEITKPISFSYPSEKICEKLKKIDAQTCELKYDKQIDLSKADLKKLKVKDLKRILADWGEEKACRGCAEKSDFIRVIKDLMPKYAPEAAKARSEL